MQARKFVGEVVKILIICLVVGMILSFFDLDALDAIRNFSKFIRSLSETIVDILEWAMPYILLGAIIVVPYYLLTWGLELLKRRRRGD